MTPSDIDLVHALGRPVQFDGRVVFTLQRADRAHDCYTSQVFAADPTTPGSHGLLAQAPGPARVSRISHGYADTALTLSVTTFGLLRAPRGGVPQLHVGEHPGAVRRLTNLDLGVSEFALSPAGTSALIVARIPEEDRYGTDPEIAAEAEAPRLIRHAQYLHNGLGYFRDRGTAVLQVPIATAGVDPLGVEDADAFPTPVPLPDLPGDASDPRFSPSGRRRSVIAPRADIPTAIVLRSTIWVFGPAPDTPAPENPASDSPGPDESAAPVALDLPATVAVQTHRWLDETRVAFIAQELDDGPTDSVARLAGLFLHDTQTGKTSRLTDPDDVDLEPTVLEISQPAEHRQSDTGGDSTTAWVAVVTDGAVRLTAVPLGDAPAMTLHDLRLLTPADAVVGGASVAPDGSLFYTAATPESFGELFALDPTHCARAARAAADRSDDAREQPARKSTRPRRLTDFGAPGPLAVPTSLSAKGAGGEVHGWVALPSGPGPHPVILNIHGGPFSQYTHALFDETQILTAAGYAVVYCNPRGSNGRGRSWGTAVKGDMAAPAAADVLGFLDAALRTHPELDAARIGVQGGSYGGYLTAMLTAGASGARFTAAIVERGFLAPESFIGTSDIGRYFAHEYLGTDPVRIAAQSPLAQAGSTQAPTLIIHSENDLRCPLEQGQQYFAALQRAGVNTEFLVFPGENHELSRSGRPRHRAQRFAAILDWWSRHL